MVNHEEHDGASSCPLCDGANAADGEAGLMRGIVLLESLVDQRIPLIPASVCRTYQHLLGGEIAVQVAELTVSRDRAMTVAMRLAEALLPQRFYAHLVDCHRMYVIFPDCVVLVRRGDDASVLFAQETGQHFGIPLAQMRFAEMFDTDHPDSTPVPHTNGVAA
jgi:hypothetical protein